MDDLRSLNIAEPRSLDLDSSIAFPGCLANLTADMLTLSITVGPYEECSCIFSLVFNVLGYDFLVLGKLFSHLTMLRVRLIIRQEQQ